MSTPAAKTIITTGPPVSREWLEAERSIAKLDRMLRPLEMELMRRDLDRRMGVSREAA